MRDRQEAHFEGACGDLLWPCAYRGDRVFGVAVFRHLPASDIGGKGARIDRRLQHLIGMRDGANVVFVGVGDKDRFDLIATLLQPRDVGQDQVHARRAIHVRKGHTDVDDDQPFFPGLAVTVDIGVHANFTRPTEGQIDKSFAAHIIQLCPYYNRGSRSGRAS